MTQDEARDVEDMDPMGGEAAKLPPRQQSGGHSRPKNPERDEMELRYIERPFEMKAVAGRRRFRGLRLHFRQRRFLQGDRRAGRVR
jgi:hypothetical protein